MKLSFWSDLGLVAAGLLALPLGFKLHEAVTKFTSLLFPWGLVWISEWRDRIVQCGNTLSPVKWRWGGGCHQALICWFVESFFPSLGLTKADWLRIQDPYYNLFFLFPNCSRRFCFGFCMLTPFFLPPSLACSPCLVTWKLSPSSFPPYCCHRISFLEYFLSSSPISQLSSGR